MFRDDFEMTPFEWHVFCLRYANRNISTILWIMDNIYGKISRETAQEIQHELVAEISRSYSMAR